MNQFQELKQRACLALSILRGRDGNLVHHAQVELLAAGHFDGDEMSALAASNAVDLLRVFSAQGHSGFSAPFLVHLFGKLAAYEPLSPITGADSEWVEVVDGQMWQNRRCSHVFKDSTDGPAYDAQAVVFEDPNGARFIGFQSRQFITFPYAPRSVVAHVPEDATDLDKQLAAEVAWAAAA